MRQLGQLESEVMQRLWSWGRPTSVREILEDLNQERSLAYTTVMTVMDNLHRKGVVSREADGRAYRYVPVQTREEHIASLIAVAVSGSSDRTAPLLRFVEQLDPGEVARLKAALDGAHTRSTRRGRPRRGDHR